MENLILIHYGVKLNSSISSFSATHPYYERFEEFGKVSSDDFGQKLHLHIFSLRARRVNVRFLFLFFLRVLGRGKRIFKDSVRLIARFYSRSEYDKPFEC